MSWHREDYVNAATALGEWLRAHPSTVIGVVCFVAGYVLGKLS
jgi:hypothetical protein